MFLWGKIPGTVESGEALADKILREARVFVTPGFVFGTAGDRYVRLSLCAPEATLAEALDRIRTK
jgi:aspartate/methionine/tyrosine aminotransferase